MINIQDKGATGGSVARDDAAFKLALADLSTTGGTIYIPALPGGPAMLKSFSIDGSPNSRTKPIQILGDGYGSRIQVAEDCAYFASLPAGWCAIDNVSIEDPTNLCTEAYILLNPAPNAENLERSITRVKITGGGGNPSARTPTAWYLRCRGAGNVIISDFFAQDIRGAIHIESGGVNCRVTGGFGSGLKDGIHIDSDPTFGHQENGVYSNITLLCQTGGGCAVRITDALDVQFNSVRGVQLGHGTHGIELDGRGSGSVILIGFDNCYFEGSDQGGKAFRSIGLVREVLYSGGGFGQGGYDPAVIDSVELIDVGDSTRSYGVTFANVNAFFPNGNANRIFSADNSVYNVVDCVGWDRGHSQNTSIGSVGNWVRTAGVPAVRSPTDTYPDADWSIFTPIVSAYSGALGALGTTSASYRRSGKTVTVHYDVTINDNGSGAQLLRFSLPTPANQAVSAQLFGQEYALTGRACTGMVYAQDLTVKFYDNTYPGASGARIILTGTYEAA